MASVYMLSLDGNTFLGLDATTEVRVERTGEVTQNTVQSGAIISDHYHSSLPRVSFSGIISNTKIKDYTPIVSEYVRLINELIDSKEFFTFYYSADYAEQEGIPTLDKCVITNFAIVQGGEKSESLEVAMSLQQLDVAQTVKKNQITLPKKETKGQLDNSKESGGGGKTEKPEDRTQAALIAAGEVEPLSIGGLFKSLFSVPTPPTTTTPTTGV